MGAIKTGCSTGSYIAYRMDGCNGVTREDCEKKAGEFRLTRDDVGGGFTVRVLEDKPTCKPACRKSSECRQPP